MNFHGLFNIHRILTKIVSLLKYKYRKFWGKFQFPMYKITFRRHNQICIIFQIIGTFCGIWWMKWIILRQSLFYLPLLLLKSFFLLQGYRMIELLSIVADKMFKITHIVVVHSISIWWYSIFFQTAVEKIAPVGGMGGFGLVCYTYRTL